MKRADLERHLRACGFLPHHHGGSHDIWLNSANQARAPVPRHREIKKGTVRGICRILGIPQPAGL